MSIQQNHIRIIQLLICAGCLVVAGSGQAQKPAPQSQVHQNITLRGPIRVDTSEPMQARTGPVYMLSLVEIADAKPVQNVWLLQKEIVQEGQPVEVRETAYKSLYAPSLREFVSRLPKGASILCTNRDIPGPDPTASVDINTALGLHDFIAHCRRNGIRFEFGIPF